MAKKSVEKAKQQKRPKKDNTVIIVFFVALIILGAFWLGMKFSPEKEEEPAKCIPSWSCSSWSECSDGVMTRTCTDSNECGDATGKPAESEACEFQPSEWEIGQEIVSYQITYSIDKVKTAESIGEREAAGLYHIIEMTITNDRDQSMTLSSLPFSIIDNQEIEYVADESVESLYNEEGIAVLTTETKFLPSGSLKVAKIFDIPADAEGLRFQIKCCDLTSRTEQINLSP